MRKKEVLEFCAKIDARLNGLGGERDKIDALLGELETVRDDALEAYDNLVAAREALSRLI